MSKDFFGWEFVVCLQSSLLHQKTRNQGNWVFSDCLKLLKVYLNQQFIVSTDPKYQIQVETALNIGFLTLILTLCTTVHCAFDIRYIPQQHCPKVPSYFVTSHFCLEISLYNVGIGPCHHRLGILKNKINIFQFHAFQVMYHLCIFIAAQNFKSDGTSLTYCVMTFFFNVFCYYIEISISDFKYKHNVFNSAQKRALLW